MNEIDPTADADSSVSPGIVLVLSAWGMNIEVMSALFIPTPTPPAGRMNVLREDNVVLAGILRDVCKKSAQSAGRPGKGIPTSQLSPASFCSSRSSIFSLSFTLATQINHGTVEEAECRYLSSSAMHRSFSRCVPIRINSKFLYSRSNSWICSIGGRWESAS